MNKKALQEQKAELLNKMEQLTSNAEVETRALNDEEIKAFEDLKKQIEQISKTLELFDTQKEMVEEPKKEKEGAEEMKDVEKRFRNGETIDIVEERAMIAEKGAQGVEVGKEIVEKLFENSAILPLTDIVTCQAESMEFLKEDELGDAGFIGEMTDVNVADFTLGKVAVKQIRCGSAIELSQHLINDRTIDIVGYSQNLVARRIGNSLAKAFITGAEDTKGKIEGLAQVSCEEVKGEVSIDTLMDVQLSMHPDLQNEAVWVINRATFNKIAKLKNVDGDYYMVKDFVNGKIVYNLLGHEVLINNAVVDNTVYFVNFKKAYKTIMKREFNISVIDNDSKNRLKGSATVVGDIYLGSSVVNVQAIKALKPAEM